MTGPYLVRKREKERRGGEVLSVVNSAEKTYFKSLLFPRKKTYLDSWKSRNWQAQVVEK
jgi:hypothetical protein